MTNKDKYSLDNISPAGSGSTLSGSYILNPQIIQAILSTNVCYHRESVRGFLIKSQSDIDDLIAEYEGKMILDYQDSGATSKTYRFYDNSFLTVWSSNKEASFELIYLDPKFKELISKFKEFVSKNKASLIYAITSDSDGLSLQNVGDASCPLVEENYTESVIKDIKFVIESFNKKDPSGRICILNGVPGSGKTTLIRSMLSQLDCINVIIPANLVDSLDKPSLVPLLLNTKASYNKPIIMIIEDGDICLVPRQNDNISAVTSLLNLSDGILGSMLDIKIIISSNAEIHNMDKAIMRPGRLCKNISVNHLTYDHALKVYNRLINVDPDDDTGDLRRGQKYTLAELYDLANNKESIVKHSKSTSIGF